MGSKKTGIDKSNGNSNRNENGTVREYGAKRIGLSCRCWEMGVGPLPLGTTVDKVFHALCIARIEDEEEMCIGGN